ncbi:hypothetical protein MRBBS_1032 [Marinobacter sp. BSs20148]|nr:hypothetical protein MRBBS_1032 [Marinobacter sp. BSs20148]
MRWPAVRAGVWVGLGRVGGKFHRYQIDLEMGNHWLGSL